MVRSLPPNKQFTDLYHIINEIINSRLERFTGLGIIIYDSQINWQSLIGLRPEIFPPSNIILGSKQAVDYLCQISRHQHPAQDGYVLSNDQELLTDIAHTGL